MAEGGVSISGGSDVLYDYFCEICIDVGRQLEAEGFCVDCEEYLCGSCYSGHKTTRSTRHHVLQDKTTMPKGTPLSQDRASMDIATKCKIHSGEPVKYYCTSHRALGCSTCFAEGHRDCHDIKSIVKESENILVSHRYIDVVANLKGIKSRSRDVEKLAHINKSTSKKCCNDVVSSVRTQTKGAIRKLREHENNIVTLAEQMMFEEEDRMDSVLTECDVMSEKTEQLLSTFESLQSSKRVCQLYITLQETETDIKALQQNVVQLEKIDVVRTLTFEPNVDVTTRLLRSPDVLGKITQEARRIRDVRPLSSSRSNVTKVTAAKLMDFRTPHSIPPSNVMASKLAEVRPPSVSVPSSVKVIKLADIDVTSVSDSYQCSITGSVAMTNNRLIIADYNNYRLKLINTNTNQLMATFDIHTRPWDVAAISNNQAVVTLPVSKKIMVFKVTDTLVKEREMLVRGECRGVAYSQDKLLVTYGDNPRLEILDLRGTVIRAIRHDSDGNKLFLNPLYVCVSKDGETVYVSDYTRHTVTSLTLDGVVKAVYNDEELKYPGKVCTDHQGHVYVCGNIGKNVYMLTADFRKVNVILTRADGLDSDVWTVSYCQDKHRLFIGMRINILKSYLLIW